MLPGKTDYLAKIREMGLFDQIITTFDKLAEPSKPVAPEKVKKSGFPPKVSFQDRVKLNSDLRKSYRKVRHGVITGRGYFDKVILGKGR